MTQYSENHHDPVRGHHTPQQREALAFFNEVAQGWADKAERDNPKKFNVIQARNHYALQVGKRLPNRRLALDFGCGSGNLACDLAEDFEKVIGIDFAPEMIERANELKAQKAVKNVEFVAESIFDFDWNQGPFDLIVANGFIEYISFQDLKNMLDLCQKHLSPNGLLVFGSRNRLFNLAAFNEFTRTEIDSGDYVKLARECVLLQTEGKWEALDELTEKDLASWPETAQSHSFTGGIGVTTRYQYSPSQLLHLVQQAGLQAMDVYPVHMHGVSPKVKDEDPELHVSFANRLQERATSLRSMIPHASTIMIACRSGNGGR